MPNDFGGGLDPSAAAPAIDNSGTLPANMPAPQPQSSNPIQQFGSVLNSITGKPNYTPPDPNASALDQSADQLQQQITRAGQVGTNPLTQLFYPDQAAKARALVPQLTEQLRTIKQQQQEQVDIQKSATNFGMPKSAQNPFMTNDTIDNWLLDQYKDGDFSKANMLKARGKGDWVQDFAGTAVDGAGARLAAANATITKLNAAGDNQAAYASTLRNLSPQERQSITALGLQTIPPKVSDWQGVVQQHGAAFMQAQQLHSQISQKLANITNFDGTVPKDVEAASQGDIRIGSTNEPAGLPVRTRAMDGQTGQIGPNGAVQMEKYGLAPKQGGWNTLTPDRLGKLRDGLTGDDVKGAINQYNIGNRFKNEALNEKNYTSAYGLSSIFDAMGGTFRDIAEKSAAAGNIGLSKFGEQQQGGFETFLNRVTNNVEAYKQWVRGGGQGAPPPAARISDETKRGIQLLAQENYDYVAKEAAGRLAGPMRQAGQYGQPLEDIPLDKDLKDSVAQYHEEGRVDAINGWRSYPSLVRGNQRIFFPQGSNVNGAQPPRPPLSAGGSAGGGSPLTPVQQAGQTPGTSSGGAGPVPSSQAPQPTGGGTGQPSATPQPVTVAGQQVNVALPPGASPAYVSSLQRIESGNERSPWTAGAQGSSASGAFQAIKGTWDQFKPPGAPARAADATPQQQADFLSNFTADNARTLTNLKLPVNDNTLYIAHNLGANGAAALLSTSPTSDARSIVGEAAARNNPTFFKGRPTVATVLQRYADAVGAPASDGGTAANLTPMQREAMARRGIETAAPGPTPEQQAGQGAQTDQDWRDNAGVLPAAGSTLGGLVGTAVGNVPGGVVGGMIGGGAGQALKDRLQGNPQSATKIGGQAVLGGLLGVASEARPVIAAGGRILGSGVIDAGTKAAEGGSTPETIDAGLKGGAEALGGTLFGHALGMAGNKIFSLFTPEAQKTVQRAAKDLHEANQTLATEQPKLATGDANPKYDAAQAVKEKAEQTIKDTMPNVKPDEAAYAHKVTSEGNVPRGEAVVMARANAAKNETSQGYNQLRQDVQDTGVGVPKANQPLPDGPIAQVRTDANQRAPVEEKFMPDAVNAERLVKAPAASWGQKWQDLQDAGTELIGKRLAFIANGDEHSAGQMDAIFKGVRNQQVAAAKYVFGPDKAPQVISRLEQLDKSWATIMTGSGGLNYGKMQSVLQSGNTQQARDMATAFKSFAGGDPGAMRAFNAMKAGAPSDWKMMIPVVAGEASANLAGIPTLGSLTAAVAATLGGQRLYRVMRQYMNAKVLGQAVKFKDFFMKDLQDTGALTNAAAGASQRGLVQGAGASDVPPQQLRFASPTTNSALRGSVPLAKDFPPGKYERLPASENVEDRRSENPAGDSLSNQVFGMTPSQVGQAFRHPFTRMNLYPKNEYHPLPGMGQSGDLSDQAGYFNIKKTR